MGNINYSKTKRADVEPYKDSRKAKYRIPVITYNPDHTSNELKVSMESEKDRASSKKNIFKKLLIEKKYIDRHVSIQRTLNITNFSIKNNSYCKKFMLMKPRYLVKTILCNE